LDVLDYKDMIKLGFTFYSSTKRALLR